MIKVTDVGITKTQREIEPRNECDNCRYEKTSARG